jgi:hypothetical protein
MEDVPPLEDTAAFSISTEDGYVRIEQSVGDQPLYTPAEARDLAADIRRAAETAESGD